MWLLVKGDGGSPRKLVNLQHIEHICITGGEKKDAFDVVAYRYPDGAGEREADWQEYDLFNDISEDEAIRAVERLARLIGFLDYPLPDNDQTAIVLPVTHSQSHDA